MSRKTRWTRFVYWLIRSERFSGGEILPDRQLEHQNYLTESNSTPAEQNDEGFVQSPETDIEEEGKAQQSS